MCDSASKLLALAAEVKPQSVPPSRFGKAPRATHKTRDLGAQREGRAGHFLRLLCADGRLRKGDLARVGTPPTVVNRVATQGLPDAVVACQTASLHRPKPSANTRALGCANAGLHHHGSACLPTSLRLASSADGNLRRCSRASARLGGAARSRRAMRSAQPRLAAVRGRHGSQGACRSSRQRIRS